MQKALHNIHAHQNSECCSSKQREKYDHLLYKINLLQEYHCIHFKVVRQASFLKKHQQAANVQVTMPKVWDRMLCWKCNLKQIKWFKSFDGRIFHLGHAILISRPSLKTGHRRVIWLMLWMRQIFGFKGLLKQRVKFPVNDGHHQILFTSNKPFLTKNATRVNFSSALAYVHS